MDDQLNVPLEDAELLGEVELTTNLIIAASESDARLSQEQVDRLLGVVETAEPPDAARAPGNGTAAAPGETESAIPQQQRRG